jgi:uncharacterized membrane protein YhiD involved in acid resistance
MVDTLLFSFGAFKLEWHSVLLSFLLAFLLSSTVSLVYQRTFRGMSWSRGMVQSMVLGSLISCLLMIAIGDNVARGIGIVGSLAIIRFRTNLRDPRDLIFLFAALAMGVASGVQSYFAAVLGCLVFCAVALAMHLSPFGERNRFDGLVRFQAPSGPETAEHLARILKTVPRTFALVTMRNVSQGESTEFAYQVAFNNDEGPARLLQALHLVEGVRGLTYMNQNTTVEL